MGQQPSKQLSKEEARMEELRSELQDYQKVCDCWDVDRWHAANLGDEAGFDLGSAKYRAAREHYERLQHEAAAVQQCLDAQREGRSLPMPPRTPRLPPLNGPPLTEPEKQAAPAPASPCGLLPDAPLGSAAAPGAQRGDSSSSSEENAHAAECSDVVPLLAPGSGRLAASLRRRQGRQQAG